MWIQSSTHQLWLWAVHTEHSETCQPLCSLSAFWWPTASILPSTFLLFKDIPSFSSHLSPASSNSGGENHMETRSWQRFKGLENVAMFKLNDINIIHGQSWRKTYSVQNEKITFSLFYRNQVVIDGISRKCKLLWKDHQKQWKSEKLTAKRRLRRHDN